MRIPDRTPERKPQPDDLVKAILVRRGGALLNLASVGLDVVVLNHLGPDGFAQGLPIMREWSVPPN